MSKSTEALTQAHERLTQAVGSIVTGEGWQRMLKTAAKFHRYSLNNVLLISLQKPDATVVAGFNRWKSLGRFVKKGEKGIAIFAPCRYKVSPENDSGSESRFSPNGDAGEPASTVPGRDSDRPKTEVIRGFRVVHVFDISQTEGEDLPDLDAVRPKLLDGDAPEGTWDALVSHAHSIGFEVIREQKRNEKGYCDFLNKKIAVRPDVAPAQAVKTLIHELGHALLHGNDVVSAREVQEVEVESVAFVVLDALGLESGAYSFPYVARWSNGSLEIVKASADRVVSCARSILRGLEVEVSDVAVEVAAPSA